MDQSYVRITIHGLALIGLHMKEIHINIIYQQSDQSWK
jgi:hypothetical protein